MTGKRIYYSRRRQRSKSINYNQRGEKRLEIVIDSLLSWVKIRRKENIFKESNKWTASMKKEGITTKQEIKKERKQEADCLE